MNPTSCVPCNPTVQSVQIPGPDGASSYTYVTAEFVVPALGAQVTVAVGNSDWMAIGMVVFIQTAGYFLVDNLVSQQSILLTYLNIAQNTATGDTIAVNSKVVSGAYATDGSDGVNSYTTTTADFTVPAISGSVSVAVANNSWMVVGQNVFVLGAGYFSVASKTGTTSVSLTYLDYAGNTHATENIASGAGISPAGTQPALSAALPTAFTDNSTGTASDTIAAGVGVFTLTIPILLVQITGAGDVLTTYTPGYAFKILSVDARVTTAVTTAAKAADLNIEIGTTNLTGGVVALTSANCTPLGAAIAGTAVTAANVGTASDTISVEAATVTAFSEGAVVLLVKIQNMDTANAFASLAEHVDDLTAALTP